MKRTEQKEKRRQQILNVGLDLFILNGYAATRTIDIAKAVGMSEGLLFHYFATKEKLYLELIEIALSGRENSFRFSDAEPLVFFETVAEYIISTCADDNFNAKLFVLMAHAENSVLLPEELRKNISGRQEMDETAKLIRQGQKDGSIKKGDPLALASVFWASVHGVVENMARNPGLTVPNPSWIVDILRKI